jgi:hypothetical protein
LKRSVAEIINNPTKNNKTVAQQSTTTTMTMTTTTKPSNLCSTTNENNETQQQDPTTNHPRWTKYQWDDQLLLRYQLTGDECMTWEAAHSFFHEALMPAALMANRNEDYLDHTQMKEMGVVGLLSATIPTTVVRDSLRPKSNASIPDIVRPCLCNPVWSCFPFTSTEQKPCDASIFPNWPREI